MDDTIYRQAAIDAVHKEFAEIILWDERGRSTANDVENILKDLPSAQPTRCKDCNHYDGEWCFNNRHYLEDYDFCSRAERRTDE